MSAGGGEHWMALEGGEAVAGCGCVICEPVRRHQRFIPERLSTDELMASTRYETDIELERLTGVRERRVVGEGEDSDTLALGAARDALRTRIVPRRISTCRWWRASVATSVVAGATPAAGVRTVKGRTVAGARSADSRSKSTGRRRRQRHDRWVTRWYRDYGRCHGATGRLESRSSARWSSRPRSGVCWRWRGGRSTRPNWAGTRPIIAKGTFASGPRSTTWLQVSMSLCTLRSSW